MKFLVKKFGWGKFKELLEAERKAVKIPVSTVEDFLKKMHTPEVAPPNPDTVADSPRGVEGSADYKIWFRDCVLDHKFQGFKGVQVRLKLGDLVTDKARQLAGIAKKFSNSEMRITIEQNLFLPWVPEKALTVCYGELSSIGLSEAGAETLEDTTTCPGADTCRLGITSAKGLGAAISESMGNGLSRFKELTRDIRVKVSGCPNGCAQHGIANIGFQGAALSKDGKTVPAHELFVGGGAMLDQTAFAERIGKFPARNCDKVVERLIELYAKEKQAKESFNACMARLGKDRLKEALAPLAEIPNFNEDPEFYKDWGHENEKFAIRAGIKGECAGAPVQEKAPVMSDAKERLAQAEAFFSHKEFANAQIETYETMAASARVPLYAALVDPFTSEQALWEFENVFVRSGRTSAEWFNFAEKAEAEKNATPSEVRAKVMIDLAKKHMAECERLHGEIAQAGLPKS